MVASWIGVVLVRLQYTDPESTVKPQVVQERI